MTNVRLYLAIGVPIFANAAMIGLLEVLDARLKHLETYRG
jgi:hypothetical protein